MEKEKTKKLEMEVIPFSKFSFLHCSIIKFLFNLELLCVHIKETEKINTAIFFLNVA